MNLNHWIEQARAHWKELQPDLYREATAEGTLDALLRDAAERTHYEVTILENVGLTPQDAWQRVREEYLFPPQKRPLPMEPVESAAARMFGPLNQMTGAALKAILTAPE